MINRTRPVIVVVVVVVFTILNIASRATALADDATTQSAAPTTTLSVVPPMSPMSFNGRGTLQYPGAKEFQLTGGGMIDLFFRAGWDASGKDIPNVGFPVDRCVITCAENADTTRYAIYVKGDLSGFGLRNGVEWRNIDFPLMKDRWYHLAVLMSPTRTAFVVNGAPAGVVDLGPNGSWPGENFDLVVGSDGLGHHHFYGEIGNLRFWRTLLPLDEIDRCADYSIPVRPQILSCLSAYTNWTVDATKMVIVSRDAAADKTIANAIAAEKNEMPWVVGGVEWTLDADAAKADAGADRLILAYATKSDGYDVGGALAEGTSLASDWWLKLSKEHSMLLLQASDADPQPMGVPAGSCGLMTGDGKLVRLFRPLNEGFVNFVITSTEAAMKAQSGSSAEDRAIALAQRAAWDKDPANVSLLKEAASAELTELTRSNVAYAIKLSEIRRLTQDYIHRKPLKEGENSEQAHDGYVTKALELIGDLPQELEPDPRLIEFAYLAWEGIQNDPSSIATATVYNFVIPLAGYDPILACYVATTADPETFAAALSPATTQSAVQPTQPAPATTTASVTPGDSSIARFDADDLTNTEVSATLSAPIAAGRNVIWCGTFNLAWNELKGFMGEPVKVEGDPPLVAALNNSQLQRDQLVATYDDLYKPWFLAVAGRGGEGGVLEHIRAQLEKHFHDAPAAELLPKSLGPDEILAYAFMYKNIEFAQPFLAKPEALNFPGASAGVRAFGLWDAPPARDSWAELAGQIRIHRYDSPLDWVVELTSKSEDDRLVIARLAPGTTLARTIDKVVAALQQGATEPFVRDDTLLVPCFNYDVNKSYAELKGRSIEGAAIKPPPPLAIAGAMQNIRFRLDERGALLKSEAAILAPPAAAAQPDAKPPKRMICDGPFAVLMVKKESSTPYLVMWIENPELLTQWR